MDLVCSLTFVSTSIQWYLMFHSVRQVFGCLLRTSWHKTLHAHCHTPCVVLLGTGLYLSSKSLCATLAASAHDDRRKRMGSQLPHQRWCRGRGVQTQRSALRWLGLSLAVLTGQVECIVSLHLYVVSLLVFVFGRAHGGCQPSPTSLPHPSQGPCFEHDQRVSDEPDGRHSAQYSCAEC